MKTFKISLTNSAGNGGIIKTVKGFFQKRSFLKSHKGYKVNYIKKS